jgi:rhodanese-related sulfurtransferase
MQLLSPSQLQAWLADTGRPPPFLLDVREPWEFSHCHIPGSTLIPMATVPVHIATLPTQTPIVVICHHGGRSMQIARMLAHEGFSPVFNLTGGVESWALTVDPHMPRY